MTQRLATALAVRQDNSVSDTERHLRVTQRLATTLAVRQDNSVSDAEEVLLLVVPRVTQTGN